MSGRLRAIFDSLCKDGKREALGSLSQRLKVSDRTIYSDVERLNSMLRQQGLALIENDRGTLRYPVRLDMDFEDIVCESEILYLDPDLRRRRILETILSMPETFMLKDLQQRFPLSRNTIVKDLGDIRRVLSRREVSLVSRQFEGYRIEGDESAIRLSLAMVLYEDNLYFETVKNQEDDAAAASARALVHTIEDALGMRYSDEAVDFLVCVIYASRLRVKAGHTMTDSHLGSDETREMQALLNKADGYIQLVCSIRPLDSQHLTDSVTHAELAFIAEQLQEARVIQPGDMIPENWVEMNLLVGRFIQSVGSEFPDVGFEEDDMLFSGLINHLRPAYWRARHNEIVANPVLDHIHMDYPELLAAVNKYIAPLERELEVSFPEEERGFFTLFFAASRERLRRTPLRRVTAIVVCREGVATSQLLRAQLDSEFDINVLGEFGVRDARAWLNQHHVDLIVSTIPFDEPASEVIEVSPWLSDKDRAALGRRLTSCAQPLDLDEVLAIVRKHTSLDNNTARKIKADLARYLGIRPKSRTERKRYQPMLKEVLTQDVIEVNFDAPDRDSAVREAGRLLVEKGAATPEYVDAMIENVEVNGTYIVIAPGIAMPHARPEKGAREVGFSLLTLKHPVVFGHPRNDPVSLVVALCAIDHQTHLLALSELADIMADETKVKRIKEAITAQEVVNLIEGGNQ